MHFPAPLIPATLVRRYKRFFAEAIDERGQTVTAHCPNPGSMLSVDAPGAAIWLSESTGAKRTLAYTWELSTAGGALVGINTQMPNRLAAEAIAAGTVAELAGYASLRREVRYGARSRVDLLLEDPDRPPCYVEVKNVTLRRRLGPGEPVEFPDCVTLRGARHLAELTAMVAGGARSVMLFIVQRGDGDHLTIARDLDPGYADAFAHAAASGVEMLAYRCHVSSVQIAVADRIPIVLS